MTVQTRARRSAPQTSREELRGQNGVGARSASIGATTVGRARGRGGLACRANDER